MDNTATVIIADNSEEFCSGLRIALQRAGGFQIIGPATDGEQAIRMITDKKPQKIFSNVHRFRA